MLRLLAFPFKVNVITPTGNVDILQQYWEGQW